MPFKLTKNPRRRKKNIFPLDKRIVGPRNQSECRHKNICACHELNFCRPGCSTVTVLTDLPRLRIHMVRMSFSQLFLAQTSSTKSCRNVWSILGDEICGRAGIISLQCVYTTCVVQNARCWKHCIYFMCMVLNVTTDDLIAVIKHTILHWSEKRKSG